ncbi:hypothetical protein DDZ13_03845 [Coraliomargarita sinensis]|uniref:Uncharacterized protein n=1 Tax=Coraliomargarita sinensis TaxID=2174842 RepID=A0A317ZHQ2_9BACT|nr:hypothetical protein [Coraliomargarita sinensis]PXA05105.1 hypothetical protein DDZ13_03845 [Coraliomargarita sinensis]
MPDIGGTSDAVSLFLEKATRALYLNSPIRFSIGCFMGATLDTALFIGNQIDPTIPELGIWRAMVLGVAFMNAPVAWALLRSDPLVDEKYLKQLRLLDEAKKSGSIAENQIRLHYQATLKEALASAKLNSKTNKKLQDIEGENGD